MSDEAYLIEALGGRRIRESGRAFRALVDYARMPAGERSLRALVGRYREEKAKGGNPPAVNKKTIERWSTGNEWQERAGNWDQAREQLRVARWLERGEVVREQDWEDGQSLRAQARELLALIKRDDLTPVQVTKLFEVASKLQRLAAGEPTDNTAATMRWPGFEEMVGRIYGDEEEGEGEPED